MQQEAEKTVDIDTSGPGADIEIKEEQKEEVNVESNENSVESVDSSEKPVGTCCSRERTKTRNARNK